MTTRVAIIGYGGAGRGIHSRLVREAGLEVTAVVVRDPARREQALADWPGVVLHDDVPGLLEVTDRYDVVVIASPTQLHVDHALAVSAARVPFVLDKPIAIDADGARAVVAAANDTGTPFTVFQNRRWDPEQLTLRSLVEAGTLGDIHTFERRWERWRPVPRDRWKENDPLGGGLLLDLGPHLVDSAIDILGPVTSVYAELRSHTTPTEDDVFLLLRHAPTADGHVNVSRLWAGSACAAPGPRTRVLGSKAAYVVSTFEGDASVFDVLDQDAPESAEGWLVRGSDREPVARAAGGHADFYRLLDLWLSGAGEVPVAPGDAVRIAEILDAARVSSREGRRVDV